MRIQIAAQIENDFLFERIVQHDPQRVESVLQKESNHCEQNERQQFLRMMQPHDVVDDSLRYRRKNDHHQCADDRAAERPGRERWVTLKISKNAPHCFHFGPNTLRSHADVHSPNLHLGRP